MALDTYSPCPGGTGKKVKFCCNDLAGELQKIDRMLEGEQVQACLSHVDALLTKYPDRACLLSTRSLVLRATHQAEAAARAVEEFLQKHPNNPVALADAAILAAEEEGGEAAMRLLQRALTASGEALEMRVYMAMGEVAEALAIEGNILAVVALLDTQIALQPDDPRPREMLLELRQSMRVPLLMKDHRWAPETPENVPWKARYEEAVSASRELRWSVCEERLTRLAGEVGDEPIVWRALAAMRGWVADKEGAMDALHKYASLPVPLDDAVEAEALARLLLDDPLGDHEDVFTVTYAVNDVDQLQTALALSRQVEAVQVNPAELTEEDQPPPRAVYHLCDRAVPEAGGPPRLQTLPKDLGLALLYGRQTDREARLELRAVLAGELDQVRTVLSNIAGPYLGEEIQRQQAAKVSRTQDLLSMRRRLPDDTSMAALRQIRSEHMEDALLDRWPQLPLGYLDGKTPEEAARLDEYRIRIRAAIMIVESWIEFQADRLDLNRLRERLGLSLPGPIDPEQTDVEKLPVVRWPRVQLEKLSDERLVNLLHFAVLCKAVQAIEHFGRAIIERPSLEGNAERLSAYNFLAAVNSSNDRAIEYIDRGRKEAEALGQSSASWDLQELRCRFARFDTEEVGRLLNHIESQHIREPGVRESLIRFLMQVGVIRPDGTRVGRARPDADSPPAAVATAEPAEEPGRLWTPESQRPAGEKPKIWMPGMD